MNSLPKVEYNELQPTLVVDTNNREQMNKLYDEVKSLISADCWAITIDDEILFNAYDKSKTVLAKIQDQMVRNNIIDNIHSSLFVHLFRDPPQKSQRYFLRSQQCFLKKDRTIILYMFGTKHWFYHIRYIISSNQLEITKYASSQYLKFRFDLQ